MTSELQMYELGVSRDFLNKRAEIAWGDIGLSRIEEQPDMRWRMIAHDRPEEDPASMADFDAVLVLRQRIDATLLSALPRLRHVSRWGAGLDRIDLEACTRAGVIVTSTPLGGRRPVAAAAVTMVLALTHRLFQKDRLVREGRWADRADYMGIGLTGRRVGIIGLGHIGRDVAHLLRAFDVQMGAYSPRARPDDASTLGVQLVSLDELLSSSDIVVVTAALTDSNYGLLSAEKLALMKPTAFLVNVGRGELIDEEALTAVLANGGIAGAGLDVFRSEPLPAASPLMKMDNVILAPHALAWTDEIIAGNAVDAVGSILEVKGNRPTEVYRESSGPNARAFSDAPRMTAQYEAKGPLEAALASRMVTLDADLSLTPVSVHLRLFRAPINPPMNTVFGTMVSRPLLLVTVLDADGTTGTGEIWCNFPLVGAEHRQNLAASLLPDLVSQRKFGNPAAVTDHVLSTLHTLSLQAGEEGPINQIAAGLDVALWDLVARRAKLPLYALFRGSRTVPVYASSIPPNAPLRLAGPAAESGHNAFKLRIGFGADRDLANLAMLRKDLGAQARLMVDANQAWSAAEARMMIAAMADVGIDWLEEPLPVDRPAGEWQSLRVPTGIPLAGGENVRGLQTFLNLIEGGPLDVLQPDIGKWGGLSGTLAVGERALSKGRRFCPHWLTGGVGFAASLHLQAILGGEDLVEFDANPNPLRQLIFDPPVTKGLVTLQDDWGHGATERLDELGRYEC